MAAAITTVVLCLAALLGGCARTADAGSEVRVRPVAATGDRPDPDAAPPRIGELELLAAFELEGSTRTFGGLSALLLDGDDGLLLLSDRGHLFRARRIEDEGTGRLSGLRDWAELPLPKAAREADTEALTRSMDGGLVVGVEGGRQLFRLAPDGQATPPPLDLPGFLRDLPANEGIEALATLSDGTLLAVSEGAYVGPDLVAAGYLDGTTAVETSVRAPDGFRPTGADVAGGTLFLLQRRFSLLGGLEARVAAAPLVQPPPPRGGEVLVLPAGRELARLGIGSFAENFEGIAARRGADGRYLLYLVADDNFSAFQRTLLLQLAWRPPAATAGR